MKTIIFCFLMTVLLSVGPQVIRAQQATVIHSQTDFSKGAKQITATYGYGQGNLLQNRNVIGVQVGYYIIDRLMVGVASSLTREWRDNFNTGSKFKAGPLVRYQFTASRLSPFAQLTYQLGTPEIGSAKHQAVVVTPGVNLALFAPV